MISNNSIPVANGDVLFFSIWKNSATDNRQYGLQDIVDMINASTISPRFRIYVLNSDETINHEIPTEDIVEGGSYQENYQNGQRRSLSFSLYNGNGKYTPGINNLWAGTRLRLDVGLGAMNGDVIWFEKGIYVVKSLSPTHSFGQDTLAIQAADKFSLFEAKTGTLDSTYEIPAGSDIEKVITDILLFNNGDGNVFDSRPFIYHSTFKGKKTQVAISKSEGDTFASILLELATQLSAEIFYNSQGNLVLVPTNEVMGDGQKRCLFHFSELKGDYDALTFNFDLTSVVNRVVVIGSSNNGQVYRAVAVNDDPASPLCYQRIGYRTGSIINDSNITTDYLAKERASYELRKQLILKSSVNLNIMFNPLLEVNNIVSITDEFFKLDSENFLIQGISCPLGYAGTMSISISNVQNLSFL